MKRLSARILAHLMRVAGLALIFGALSLAAGMRLVQAYPSGPPPAWPGLLAGLYRAIPHAEASVATPVPAAVPSSTPSPAPTRGPAVVRGGPLEFSLTGSLSLGAQYVKTAQSDQNGFGPGGASMAYQSSMNQASESAGMTADIERRTATTTTDIRIPLGLSSRGSTFGQSLITFATPRYAIGLGSAPITFFGQLPLGLTARQVSLTVPSDNGELSLFDGSAYGGDLGTVGVTGLRERRLLGRQLVEMGVVHSGSSAGLDPATTLFAGVATGDARSDFVGEAAWQHGFGFQARYDYNAPGSVWDVTARALPQGFLSYGTGLVYGDRYLDVGWHRMADGKTFALDEAFERSAYQGVENTQRRSDFQFGSALGADSYTVNLQEQYVGGTLFPQWNGMAGFTLEMPSKFGFAMLGGQFSRLTQTGTPPVGSASWNAELQTQLHSFTLQLNAQTLRQSSDFLGVSRQSGGSFGIVKNFGKTSIGYTYQLVHTQTPISNALQRTPQILVQRQISPVIAVQLNYGTQRLTDSLNPAADGRSRIFGVQLNAPFALGNGAVMGRVDPRLPATIQGRVIADLGQEGSQFASYAAGGIGNAVVILDGKTLQRTDLSGNFQFSFVQPGQHQLRIESSSLPRGLTVDQPVITLDVEGGQTGQAFFRVGDFGGVAGHVFGLDSDGNRIPLANVMVRIDTGAYSQTDQEGTYGFGRLTAGKHTVSIVPQSVPAFAAFDPSALSQSVTVDTGSVAKADFIAEPLGSIAGTVTYDPALAPDHKGPVLNAYVVAEPGEHAAITEDDGTFLIDDLPPGTYSVSVDPETVPDQTGPEGEPLTVVLAPREHYRGAVFHVGREQKKIVFSFGGAQTPDLHVTESRLPPGGTTDVTVDAPESARRVSVTAFGHVRELAFDRKRALWEGEVFVPDSQRGGVYRVSASVASGAAPQPQQLTVDPQMPIAIVQTTPRDPKVGQYVSVRARFLVDVRPGDRIQWEDGTTTILGKPVAGRIFTFTLRISLRPLHGRLLTRHASLPIRLL